MPVYEYACPNCGVFSELGLMSESSRPASCPDCATLAPRVLSVPRLTLLSRAQRIAGDRNEKSAHEPMRLNRKTCHSGTCNHKPVSRPRAPGRPWMLGH